MPWTESVIRERLPNGLTVLVQRDATIPVVAVVTHVRAGYFDEPDEWVGISHVLEHMFFKGTERVGPGGLARETQRLGGYLNAGTIYDKTVYYTVVPAVNGGLRRTAELQADALMHAALDREELARELEVIVQEARRKLDAPEAVTAETLYGLLFRTHRMGRWRIGTEDELRRLTAEDVLTYYRTRYTPDRTIVALTGHLDPDEALSLAREVYGSWEAAPGEVAGSPPEPPGAEARLRVLHGDVERPLAALGWKTVGPRHEETPALDVAAAILGEGRGSWLFRALRQPGLAGAAGATHYTPYDIGAFDISLAGNRGRLDDAVARVLALVGELADRGPSAADVERVRAMIATQWARRFESADGRGAVLCQFEALGDVRLADEYLDRLMDVSREDVRAAVRRHLNPAVACAVLFLPEGAATRYTEDTWPPA